MSYRNECRLRDVPQDSFKKPPWSAQDFQAVFRSCFVFLPADKPLATTDSSQGLVLRVYVARIPRAALAEMCKSTDHSADVT